MKNNDLESDDSCTFLLEATPCLYADLLCGRSQQENSLSCWNNQELPSWQDGGFKIRQGTKASGPLRKNLEGVGPRLS